MKPTAEWWGARAHADAPGRLDPRAVALWLRLAAPLLRLAHRPTLTGAHHLPRDRPFVLVANHSGGLGFSEINCLLLMKLQHFPTLPIAPLAHPVSFHLWPLTLIMRWGGAIPSTRAAAAEALRDGIPVLVFPGGDHEVSRPMWQAHRVDFAGRRGFVRMARDANAPIVPLGIRGSHLSVPILARSRLLPWLLVLPRVFGIKRYPLTLTAVLGAIALITLLPSHLGGLATAVITWLWMASPLPLLPVIPVRIRYRIGEVIEPDELSDLDLIAAQALVQDRVQALVAEA